jgi:hypothetical protein
MQVEIPGVFQRLRGLAYYTLHNITSHFRVMHPSVIQNKEVAAAESSPLHQPRALHHPQKIPSIICLSPRGEDPARCVICNCTI